MNLQAIVKYLDDEGFGIMGQDLFRDNLPDGIYEGLAVFSITPVPIHPYLGISHGIFQIVGRGTDQDALHIRMKSVSDAFKGGRGLVLDDMKFFFIRPEHEPMFFPRSESDLIEASVSFEFSYIQQA